MVSDLPKLFLPVYWRFVVDCLTSGTIAGLATLLVTSSIERFGGIVGGIVGTVPSTIVISAIGLFFLEKQSKISITMDTVPIGMLLSLVILLLWRLVPSKLPRYFSSEQRLVIMVMISLIIWLTLAYAVVYIVEELITYNLNLALTGCAALSFYFIIAALVVFVPTLPVGRKGDETVSNIHRLLRFLIGFGATVIAIMLATWNEYAGGVAIAFPSVILTSLGSLWISQEETVSTSAACPLILGSTTTSIFALIFGWAAPILEHQYGPIGGLVVTILSVWFLCAYGFSLPMVFLLRKKEIASSISVAHIVLSEETEDTENENLYNGSSVVRYT